MPHSLLPSTDSVQGQPGALGRRQQEVCVRPWAHRRRVQQLPARLDQHSKRRHLRRQAIPQVWSYTGWLYRRHRRMQRRLRSLQLCRMPILRTRMPGLVLQALPRRDHQCVRTCRLPRLRQERHRVSHVCCCAPADAEPAVHSHVVCPLRAHALVKPAGPVTGTSDGGASGHQASGAERCRLTAYAAATVG